MNVIGQHGALAEAYFNSHPHRSSPGRVFALPILVERHLQGFLISPTHQQRECDKAA